MRRLRKNLKVTLAAGFAVVLLLVCSGLYLSFDQQSRKAAIEAAQSSQNASLRILVDKFASRMDGISFQLDDAGRVSEVRWNALEVPESHDLIDEVGMISGETATLFQWVPEEGDFIRRTTNIVKPDGSRAVGTWLGKENPVHAVMLEKRAYMGQAVILGKPYYTVYQPILDAADNVIGIFYVGVFKGVIDQQVANREMLGFVASAIAVGLGMAVVMFLLNWSLKPAVHISERLQGMAEGELEAPVPHTDRNDALGTTAKVVETFRNKLINAASAEERSQEEREIQAKVVAGLRRGLEALARRDLTARIDAKGFPKEYETLRRDFDAGVESLADALRQAEGVASNVRSAASEIGSTSDELARRVEMQAATLMTSAEALNGLTGTSREIKTNVDQADELARKSRQLSDESGQVVKDAIAAINRIEATSDKINQIITAIDDIAFQTNLLALNAGVEAARAGSAGKGFAVVASEVRGLAQTAANSAQEIKTLITASGEEVSEGSRLVQKTGTSLNEVQAQVASLGQLISNIAEAVRVQTDGLGDINDGVQRLEGATQENAAIVEELNASGQSLNIEAERLTETMGLFKQEADVPKGNWDSDAAQPAPKTKAETPKPAAKPTPKPKLDQNKPEPEIMVEKKAVNAPLPIAPAPVSSGSDTDWGEEF
ncbi:methyl-accepting chemotaxis protein [Sagittula sp. S175]|uniref:methyl-accepting chemotaxis protein n=1 Tax=Sagittula sp. S175 TaxID=3415129 RepID=UPI003C7D906F